MSNWQPHTIDRNLLLSFLRFLYRICDRLLESLDLSFNYFSEEQALMPLLELMRLDKLMIYGNPLLGPTGEDPLRSYIDAFVEASYEARSGFTDRALEVRQRVEV